MSTCKSLCTIALSLLLLCSSHAQLTPIERKALSTTHYIEQEVISDGSGCSATAIGPHALLTATHCEIPTDTLTLVGQDNPARVAERIRDERDHTIYLLKDATFTDFAEVKLGDPLDTGTNVFIWGNPQEWTNILRRGYIQGEADKCTIYSFAIDHGDSGAAVFNTHGQVIAVISRWVRDSRMEGAMVAAASYALAFTQADIEKARTFGTDKS